jgi:hypothetical protein
MRWLPPLLIVVVALAGVGLARRTDDATSPTPAAGRPIHGLPGAPLLSVAATAPPAIDGIVEATWQPAPRLVVPLHYGLHGNEAAGTLEMRSLYDEERVYFLVRWQSGPPVGELNVWRNLLTVHWRLEDTGQLAGQAGGDGMPACTVACHTATTDGRGRLVAMRTETIPPGLEVDLPHAGGWADGMWSIEWSRPRVSESPYDLQISDAARGYPFFIKIISDEEGRADQVSDLHALWLNH